MANRRQLLGKWGETMAADYLVEQGYFILERNVRTRYGEIDLVARFSETSLFPSETCVVTVFVEVKTRSTSSFGLPEESVTARKRDHLIAAAQAYLQEHPELGDAWRIDVIAIQQLQPGKPASIHHFENAIQ
jgi:putative endonuclease